MEEEEKEGDTAGFEWTIGGGGPEKLVGLGAVRVGLAGMPAAISAEARTTNASFPSMYDVIRIVHVKIN